MKTIGLVGGITWYSTLDYYRLLNEGMNQRMGGVHSARIILNSVDFAEIKVLTEQQHWDGLASIMCRAAKDVEAAGASCLMIGANTMHHIADRIQASVNIPLIHIADAVAVAIKKMGLKKIALLGTKYTMQMDFYKNRLATHGIETVIPGDRDIEYINHTIYAQFSNGMFLPETKDQYLSIINKLIEMGAEGVIFGCTEIPILLKHVDCGVPVFDSAHIHSIAAIEFALGN